MSSIDSTENMEPDSSQVSQELPLSDPLTSSTQPPLPTYGLSSRKEQRNPSITPKKFTRFFTPRSQLSRDSARRILNDITAPSNNRRGNLSRSVRSNSRADKDELSSTFSKGLKRRKLLHTPEDTPELTTAAREGQEKIEVLQDEDSENELQNIQSSPCERAAQWGEERDEEDGIKVANEKSLQRIIQVGQRGPSGQLLHTIAGLPTMHRRQRYAYSVNGKYPFERVQETKLMGG